MGKENIVLEKLYKFAISIIKIYKHILKDDKEYVLSNKDIFSKADEIGRLLFSILKSTRISNHWSLIIEKRGEI